MKEIRPDAPAPYDKAVMNAVAAFMAGVANEGQQVTVRDWILHSVCRVDGQSYFRGESGDRDTAYAEGKRYVANSLRKMTNPIVRVAQDMKEAELAAREEANK